MPIFRVPPPPFRGIRSAAPALSGAAQSDKTFTATISLQKVADKTFSVRAAVNGTVYSEFSVATSLALLKSATFTASVATYFPIDNPFSASVSTSGSRTKTFTASASLVRLGAQSISFSASVSLALYDATAAQSVTFSIPSTESHYELRLVHQDGSRYLDSLDMVLAFDYSLVLNDISVCNLTLPGNYPIRNLAKDNRIEVWRSIGDRPLKLEGDTQFLIQTVVREVDANGAKVIKVTAYGLNDLLRRRVVAAPSDSIGLGYKIDYADSMMDDVVWENLGPSADIVGVPPGTGRVIPNFTTGGTLQLGPTIEMDVSYKYVLDVLKDIANASFTKGVPLFFEVICTEPPQQLVFTVFVNQRGLDRRASTGNGITFSQANGSVGQYTVTEDWSNELNFVYAFGPGEGDLQMVTVQQDVARSKATIFSRKECVYSNNEADDLNALDAAAQAQLTQNRPRKLFNGTIINTPTALYGRDWAIGYWVTAEDEDDAFDCYVAAVQVSVDAGKEDVQAVLRNDFSWT